MKKQYETPEIQVIVLEQSDIITTSPNTTNGFGTQNGFKPGELDNWA